MALLVVDNVSKHFPGVQALSSVSFDVESGTVHALVGENGAGKSTLVKIISGAQSPDSGRILFDEATIETYTPAYASAHGISVVYQRQQLIPFLSVAENILLGQQPRRFNVLVDDIKTRRIARELLNRLRVNINPAVLVANLSPAQQQEIAIAKALYRNAKLIILDEPTAALDLAQIERLFELIQDLCSQGIGVLYISHHLEEIFRLATTITILRDGRVVTTQPTRELTQGEVVSLMARQHEKQAPATSPIAGDTTASAPSKSFSDESPLLEIHGVTAGHVLQDIDFVVERGQVVGITGIVGAGGHDLAQVLFGLLHPTAGQCLLNEAPYTPHNPAEAIARGIFLIPENPGRDGLVGQLSIAQNITLIDLHKVTRFGLLQLGTEATVAREYVSSLRIAPPTIRREVRLLSGGNQQKVLLAKGLQAKAQVLVLEEPTQGVDVNAKDEIHRLIRDLAATGKAIVVISTDIRDLLQCTTRIIVLRKGRIIANMPTSTADYTHILNLTVGTEDIAWSQEKA